jgi:hypothetical protein
VVSSPLERCVSNRETDIGPALLRAHCADDIAFRFQLGKSVYNGPRYRSVESIVVL